MADRDIDSSSEGTEDLLREDSEGWEDAEPDEEDLQVKDFFSDKIFPDALSMIKYCAENHGLDFIRIRKDFGGYVCLSLRARKDVCSSVHRSRLLWKHQACELSPLRSEERKFETGCLFKGTLPR